MTIDLMPVNLDRAFANEFRVHFRHRLFGSPAARCPLLDSEIVVVDRDLVDRMLSAPRQSMLNRGKFACYLVSAGDLGSINSAEEFLNNLTVLKDDGSVTS